MYCYLYIIACQHVFYYIIYPSFYQFSCNIHYLVFFRAEESLGRLLALPSKQSFHLQPLGTQVSIMQITLALPSSSPSGVSRPVSLLPVAPGRAKTEEHRGPGGTLHLT